MSALTFTQTVPADWQAILTPEAVDFIADLEHRFGSERRRLLRLRQALQTRLDAGEKPNFPLETQAIRSADWKIAGTPRDLQDRRVEITGPTERKMIINALNSGAKCFMADLEDSTTPSFANVIEGQINLKDAILGRIAYRDPERNKDYSVGPNPAVLIVRPRGWHLDERHMLLDGQPVSGSLVDFGLYFFHNATALLEKGSGPYFYLPKLENHHEARLWNTVFLHAQSRLGLPVGSIKATVLIETILATFEMDEILYVLRDHIVGLNCGRWDYIFSFIKKFACDRHAQLPERAQVTMTTHFLRSYSRLLIKTCHRRGAHAMGGMAAQIPIKGDEQANDAAIAKVRADKEREAGDGHDGTWVAHPGLVPVALEVFDRLMPGPNQLSKLRDDVAVAAKDLLEIPKGTITEAGLRNNVNVGLGYTEAWLRGIGCVPLHNLMEDAATAEIARAQLWQWVRHKAKLDDGRAIDLALVRRLIKEESDGLQAAAAGRQNRYETAAELLDRLVANDQFEPFLTNGAYERIVAEGA